MKRVKIFGAIVFSIVLIVTVTPVIEAKESTETTIVYVTKTGEKNHTDDCSYLRKSKIKKSLSDAVDEGYEPCSRCNPPVVEDFY